MRKLSPQKVAAMQVIWQLGETNVRAIQDQLGVTWIPFTTRASTIKNLEKINILSVAKLAM